MPHSWFMSTDVLAPRDRAPQWREWVSQHFGGLESDFYGDTTFDGHMAATRAGDVILTKLEATRHRVMRTPQMARASEGDYLKIVAPWQGSACVEQQNRQASAGPGGWIIYDTTGSYEISNPQRVDHLIVMVPKNDLLVRSLRLPHLIARHLGASGISRVALEAMRTTYQELPHMSDAAAQGAGQLIKQLVQLSLLELAGQDTAVSQREALRDRFRSYVAQHLSDPQLSVDSIARALNCSRRHLYNTVSGEGESVAAYIQRQRLQACVRDLQNAHAPTRAITDIALSWGFGNPSHFSRVFREHTGASPSEFRSAAKPGSPLA